MGCKLQLKGKFADEDSFTTGNKVIILELHHQVRIDIEYAPENRERYNIFAPEKKMLAKLTDRIYLVLNQSKPYIG